MMARKKRPSETPCAPSAPLANLEHELRRNGDLRDPRARLAPLAGGVSSEICLVEDGGKKFVVKRALAKLKVKEDWFADVSRNENERRYLDFVGRLLPGTVPRVCFSNTKSGYFAMEYLGEGFSNWKQLLIAGTCRVEHARAAGRMLGKIHRLTRGDVLLAKTFDTITNFRQLRLEPYLLATASRHPDLKEIFSAEVARIESARESLVHGDFSPKNILIKGRRMVLLDCEVAWYGDPAFDVAFFLNHLFLKLLLHAPAKLGFENMIAGFWSEYMKTAASPGSAKIGRAVLGLVPLLMLARVDGKSPVEYLDAARQDIVRRFVYERLTQGEIGLSAFVEKWTAATGALHQR
jgi:aminoglycoside phosphotransferase (APT) family kinase protein